MSEWQPFGYKGIPGTCVWCGRKLRREQVMAEEGEAGARQVGYQFWTKPAEKLGGYQDGLFCGLRCGYQWAAAHARPACERG